MSYYDGDTCPLRVSLLCAGGPTLSSFPHLHLSYHGHSHISQPSRQAADGLSSLGPHFPRPSGFPHSLLIFLIILIDVPALPHGQPAQAFHLAFPCVRAVNPSRAPMMICLFPVSPKQTIF